jgi:hypothetical protein
MKQSSCVGSADATRYTFRLSISASHQIDTEALLLPYVPDNLRRREEIILKFEYIYTIIMMYLFPSY